jgi:hypothetical protein
LPIKAKRISKFKATGNVWGLHFCGDTARAFFHYIYRDCDGIRLKRKHDRYVDYLNREGVYAPPILTDRIIRNKERQLEELEFFELKCA